MLPTTGAISFNDLKNEFGDVNPISINEFYAGGGKVPLNAAGGSGLLPTLGQIDINKFHGSSGSLLSGSHWTAITPTVAIGNTIGVSPSMLLSYTSQVHRSTDHGSTWQVLNFGTFPIATVRGLTLQQLPTPNVQPVYINGQWYTSCYQNYSSDSAAGHYEGPDYGLVVGDGVSFPTYLQELGMTGLVPVSITAGSLYNIPTIVVKLNDNIFSPGCYASVWDGSAWSYVSLSNTSTLAGKIIFIRGMTGALAYGADGMYIFVDGYNIRTSVDAFTWTIRSIYDSLGSLSYPAIQNYTEHNGVFLAIASGGKIVSSSDGVNYTLSSSALPNAYPNAAYGFIASCGTYALAIYKNMSMQWTTAWSIDGQSWTEKASLELATQAITSLACDGPYWLIQSSTTRIWRAPV